MEEMLELKDRFKKLLDHYSLSPDTLSKKIGGSRGTYFAMQSGKSKPDFATSENILKSFPDISAEWWFRGSGPMLKKEIVSQEEVDVIMAENRAIKAMYRAELLGKSEGALLWPERDKEFRSELKKQTIAKVRNSDRKRTSKSISVRVQGAKVPSLVELFNL